MNGIRISRRHWIRGGAAAGAVRLLGPARPAFALLSGVAQPPGPPVESLKARAREKRLNTGAAVNTSLLARDETYRRVLAEQYSMVVGENCMKWSPLRPSPDTFHFNDADLLVSFAEEHGLKVRGHNLCWHESLPSWFGETVTRENAREILTGHISAVAGRYRGRIHSWDVVNEAISIKDGRGDGLRSSSPWFELLGPEYIEIAFRAARAADPSALLTYNDYGIEYDLPEEQQKRAAVLALVDRLRHAPPAGGRPLLDAVGIQSHLKTGNVTALGGGIRDFAGKARKLGLEVFLTELDVDDDGLPDGETADPAQQDRDVAAVYRHFLDAMLRERSVTAILTWGVADGQSWLQGEKFRPKHPNRMERPLPFLVDEAGAYRAKPAYFAMLEAVTAAKTR